MEFGKVFIQLVVPQQYRKMVMKLAHESIMSGHLAIKRTIQKVLAEFFWPVMNSDNALKDWKLNIFKIIDRRIFYSQNTNMLPRKPKISYRYLKSGIEEFHRKFVLVPAGKAANNVVVV